MGRFSEAIGGVPLRATDIVDAVRCARLEALSITTVEELLSVVRAAPDALARFLDVDLAWLDADVEVTHGSSWNRVHEMEEQHGGARFALGALAPPGLDVEVVARQSTFDRMIADLVVSTPPVDTGAVLTCHGPIRDQGQRGTCVAHAGAAVMECVHHAATGRLIDLSPQLLYWNAKAVDGYPTEEGTWSAAALPTVVGQGICEEHDWPYEPDFRPDDLTHGPPPKDAVTRARGHRAASVVTLDPRSSSGIRDAVEQGTTVTISVPVYRSWWGPVTNRTGKIPMPLPNAVLDGGHAMCVIGYDFDETFTGGGYFVLRNSWGTAWAPANPNGPGHGAIPFEYIDRYGWEAFTLALATS